MPSPQVFEGEGVAGPHGEDCLIRLDGLGELTPERINQQRGLIDELLATTEEPAAVEALEQSKALLSKRARLMITTPGK